MMLYTALRQTIFAASLIPASSFAAPAINAPPANTPGRYAPRDECTRVPGAAAFRAALTGAVARRNADTLAALAASNVQLDFGGGSGRETLRRTLRGRGGAERWKALERILPLGCAVQQRELVLPWLFAQDLGGLDPFDVLLVTGANVPLLSRPDKAATVNARVSWQLISPLAGFDPGKEFQQVRVAGRSGTGYIATRFLRSPINYRLIASRSGATWRISAFIAGD